MYQKQGATLSIFLGTFLFRTYLHFELYPFQMLVLQQLLGAFCVIFPSLVYAKFVASSLKRALSVLGIICIAASVVNFGSPLAAIVS